MDDNLTPLCAVFVSSNTVYSDSANPAYLDLLNCVSQQLHSDIDSIEMLLFAKAEKIAQELLVGR